MTLTKRLSGVSESSALTLTQALEELGIKCFSSGAVELYKQAQLEKVWDESGLGGRFIATHGSERFWRVWFCYTSWALAVASLSGLGYALEQSRLWALGNMLVFGVLFFLPLHVMRIGDRGALNSRWESQDLFVCNLPHEIPDHGRQLCSQLARATGVHVTGVRFHIHRFYLDPLLSISSRDEPEEQYFYGFTGRNELVEIDGRLIEAPALQ